MPKVKAAARDGRRRDRPRRARRPTAASTSTSTARRSGSSPTTSTCAPTSHEEFALAEDGGVAVALDTRLDDDLRLEGLAREVIRMLNDHRKAKGLEISDRIVAWLRAAGDIGDGRRPATGTGSPARCSPPSCTWSADSAGLPAATTPIAVGRRHGRRQDREGLSCVVPERSSGGGGTDPTSRRRPRTSRSSPGPRHAGRAATGR